MKNRFLLLCALLMVGCGGNGTSTSSSEESRTNYNSQSSEVKTSESSKNENSGNNNSTNDSSNKGENSTTSSNKGENSGTNDGNTDPEPSYDNANNLVDIEKVLNLQCSKGTAYGGQYCDDEDKGGYYGSWYCDWEGWWCEYTKAGDYGVDVTSPTNCDYSGADSWYVQLNVPYGQWKTNTTYKFAFDLKSTVDTEGEQCPIKTESINADLLNKDKQFLFTIGSFKANNAEYTHYEFTITTAADLTAENYISFSLGGRGTLNYQFRNLYLGVVTE